MAVFRGEQPADFEEDQTKPVRGHVNVRMDAAVQASDGSKVNVVAIGAVGTDWREEPQANESEFDGLPTETLSDLPDGYKQEARKKLGMKAQKIGRGKKSAKKGARG